MFSAADIAFLSTGLATSVVIAILLVWLLKRQPKAKRKRKYRDVLARRLRKSLESERKPGAGRRPKKHDEGR